MVSPLDLAGRHSENARVFFALWPDAPLRKAMSTVSRTLHAARGGRMTRPETMHLTLLFLGAVPRTQFPALIEGAQSIAAPIFETRFDYTACWRHNQIAFLGAHRPPESLLDLVKALESVATGLGLVFDQRAYTPHVTLIRHAQCAKPAADNTLELESPLQWPARDFVLVESKPGPGGITYPVLARFPLTAMTMQND